METIKVMLKWLFWLTALAVIGLAVHQYGNYLIYRVDIHEADEQNLRLLEEVEPVRQRQAAFMEELSDITQRYDALREQLPGELQLTQFKRYVEGIFEKAGVKILAQREAHNYRSSYREVKLIYSLRGSVKTVKALLSQIKQGTRLVLSEGPVSESSKNSGLVLSIFSVPMDEFQPQSIQACIEEPAELLLPHLHNEIALLYDEYRWRCQRLHQSAALYQDIQRYHYQQKAIAQLDEVLQSLTR